MYISSDKSVPDYGSWCPAKTPILLAVFGYKGGSPAVWNFMSISLPTPLPGALKDDRWNDWRPGTEIQAQRRTVGKGIGDGPTFYRARRYRYGARQLCPSRLSWSWPLELVPRDFAARPLDTKSVFVRGMEECSIRKIWMHTEKCPCFVAGKVEKMLKIGVKLTQKWLKSCTWQLDWF